MLPLVTFEDAISLFKVEETVHLAERNAIISYYLSQDPYQRIKTQRKRTSFIERGLNPPFHTSFPVHCMRYAVGCRGNDASSVVAQLALDIPYSLPS
jgi:hypothetical protein